MVVISNSSPIIHLAKIGRLNLLERLYSRIFETINAKAELSRVDAQIAVVEKGHLPIDHGNASGEFEHGDDNTGNGDGQAE